ncbi:MAG TPA: DUF1559 domain-containing protein [Gemmatales bacterium]|nr:DUF1559 domain-containing protein [Gemmatales bacterium]HMP58018.1 DUF1559 domain-containing protein [Gemmatales bacterium]
MPAIQRIRGLADRTACQSQMRQIVTAAHVFHHDHGTLPPTTRGSDLVNSRLSWMVHLLPYIEQRPAYFTALQDLETLPDFRELTQHRGHQTVMKLYVCPGDPRLAVVLADSYGDLGSFTSYIACVGLRAGPSPRLVRGAIGRRLEEITDGVSYTILIGERPPPASLIAGWWYPNIQFWLQPRRGPNNEFIFGVTPYHDPTPDCAVTPHVFGPGRLLNPCDRFHYWSLHGGGANFAFADGSVRFFAYSAGSDLIRAMLTINGGEQVTLD